MSSEETGWRVTRKRTIGLYMSGPVSGPGWKGEGYYHAIYEVDEVNKKEGKFRTRVVFGDACREYGEGYETACHFYRIYLKHAERHDSKS